jgi:hypothetical protein
VTLRNVAGMDVPVVLLFSASNSASSSFVRAFLRYSRVAEPLEDPMNPRQTGLRAVGGAIRLEGKNQRSTVG